jgi:hypothetical protein
MFMCILEGQSKARGVALLTKSGPIIAEEGRIPVQYEVTTGRLSHTHIQHNITTSNPPGKEH